MFLHMGDSPRAPGRSGGVMESFDAKLAVITGAGDGMGRSLAIKLTAAGCHVALCDLFPESVARTAELCAAAASSNVRISHHVCDVSDESQWLAFRDAALAEHDSAHINLLFNNAGVAGGGSMLENDRAQWERTFDVCWGGVYLGVRTFLPALVASDEGRIVNTSSVNGFWASMGPDVAHTSYSAAKFAVKGFTEALITDMKLHAPHVEASVVMPGHIGTGIAENSVAVHGREADPGITERAANFRNSAPMTADEAADVILDGVRNRRWRILVGEDAHILDNEVRADPEAAYDADFGSRLAGAFEGITRNQS